MKKKITLFLLAGVVLLFAACSQTPPKSEGSNPDSATNSENNEQGEVIINVYNKKPTSLDDKNTILINGVMDGEEYIEAVVKGEVYDFEHVALSWDEKANDVVEQETIKKFDKLKDQTIVIKTYQPEGIPSEKIKWKNSAGVSSEYIIAQNNLDEDLNVE